MNDGDCSLTIQQCWNLGAVPRLILHMLSQVRYESFIKSSKYLQMLYMSLPLSYATLKSFQQTPPKALSV
jgi:hypothetical protein